uniref:Uncharacterized protein n=1 Tax=Rhinopithecus roxellana TaxID=61622 RepID=A0A2K6QSU6_RHIRO
SKLSQGLGAWLHGFGVCYEGCCILGREIKWRERAVRSVGHQSCLLHYLLAMILLGDNSALWRCW